MRLSQVLINALGLYLGWTAVAHADPITTAIFGAAFASTFLGSVVSLGITVALNVGVSLLAKALLSPSQSSTAVAPVGVSTTATFGDATPIGFPVGTTATAGTFIYGGEWGNDGDTPNAYSTDVYVLSDMPSASDPVIWVNGQKCTIDWTATPTAQGYPVLEFRDGGVDYLWVRNNNGTQTVADSFLTSTFGSDPNRPWTSTMVGIGVSFVVVTALYNRNLFQNFNKYLWEPGHTTFYDISLDSTAGGSGSHRWNTPSTWQVTSNPKIIAYNLMRGVYYGSEWVFGGQNLSASRLPASSWIAAINACRVQIDLAAGGTENQFRCGMMVTGDMEPLSVVEELDKASSSYTAEVGGKFKTIAGAPGAAVYSFTDADVLVTRDQTLEPFPAFSATYNVIQATYPEPSEQWQSKDAPDLEDSDLIASDGGFYLPTSAAFAAVPFAVQVQRLMKTLLNVGRRFRLHTLYLPPDAWVLEPGVDIVAWTSAANGYTSKTFLVTTRVGNPGFQQQVTLLELDPGADYAWSTSDEQSVTTSFVGIVRPAAQPVVGFSATGAIVFDADGVARRPTIQLTWNGDQPDVEYIAWQVRLAADASAVAAGQIEDVAADAGTLPAGPYLSLTDYQVRIKYLPFSQRRTLWSNETLDESGNVVEGDWVDVTTPDVGLTAADIARFAIEMEKLSQDLQNIQGIVTGAGGIAAQLDALRAQMAADALAALTDQSTMAVKTDQLSIQVGNSSASIAIEQQVRATGDTALADQLTIVETNIDDNSAAILTEQTAREDADTAEALARQEAIASLGTAYADDLVSLDVIAGGGGSSSATFAIKVRAQNTDTMADSGVIIKATQDGHGGTTSQILLQASQLFITDGTHSANAFTFDATSGALVLKTLRFQQLLDLAGTHISMNGNTGGATFST